MARPKYDIDYIKENNKATQDKSNRSKNGGVSPMRVVGVIVIIVGVLLIAGGILFAVMESNTDKNAIVTIGEVISYEIVGEESEDFNWYKARVQYDVDGTTMVCTLENLPEEPEIGEKIAVYYMADTPEVAYQVGEEFHLDFILICVGGVIIAAGLLPFAIKKKRGGSQQTYDIDINQETGKPKKKKFYVNYGAVAIGIVGLMIIGMAVCMAVEVSTPVDMAEYTGATIEYIDSRIVNERDENGYINGDLEYEYSANVLYRVYGEEFRAVIEDFPAEDGYAIGDDISIYYFETNHEVAFLAHNEISSFTIILGTFGFIIFIFSLVLLYKYNEQKKREESINRMFQGR